MNHADDLLFDQDFSPSEAPVTRPPDRWRNKWYLASGEWSDDGPAERFGTKTWPSREIAETKALYDIAEYERLAKLLRMEPPVYLGAFPVEGEQ